MGSSVCWPSKKAARDVDCTLYKGANSRRGEESALTAWLRELACSLQDSHNIHPRRTTAQSEGDMCKKSIKGFGLVATGMGATLARAALAS